MGRLAGLRERRLTGRGGWLPVFLAVIAGGIFVAFGAGHFAGHGSEVADFRRYQVPFPSVAVWTVGVVELGGGTALLLGLFVRLTAAVLALDLVGELATAGRVEGGFVNLGLASMLLAAMVFLVWAGPGNLSFDVGLRRLSAAVHRMGIPPLNRRGTQSGTSTDGA
jgi:putative oxidoreductase